MSGEYNGAAIFVLENVSMKKPGLLGGIFTSSGAAGMLLASSISWIIFQLVEIYPMAWRIAFLGCFPLGLFGFYIRNSLTEERLLWSPSKSLGLKGIQLESSIFKKIIQSIMLSGFSGALIYFIFIFSSAFLLIISDVSSKNLAFLSTVNLFIYILSLWSMGWLSDALGCKKVLFMCTLLIIIFSYPLFYIMTLGKIFLTLLSFLMFSLLTAGVLAPSHVLMKNLFLPTQRYTLVSLSFNIGMIVFGAPTSSIAFFIYNETHNQTLPVLYLIFCAFLNLFCIFSWKGIKLKNKEIALERVEAL